MFISILDNAEMLAGSMFPSKLSVAVAPGSVKLVSSSTEITGSPTSEITGAVLSFTITVRFFWIAILPALSDTL